MRCTLGLSAESRKMHQVGLRYRLYRIAGFAPRGEAAVDHKGAESLLHQLIRHTGAGRFVGSSAVEIDVFIPGETFDFLGEVIRLQSNRAANAVGTGVVVTVAAHVGQQNLF